jgi:hypothetical protein
MSQYQAGGNNGNRERDGDKGFREAKGNLNHKLPIFLVCDCCGEFMSKPALENCLANGEDIGKYGFAKFEDDYYHAHCVCSFCGTPAEPNNQIFFQTEGAHVSTRIPYYCDCMKGFGIEAKLRLFSGDIDGNSLIRLPSRGLLNNASDKELIDYFRVWGEFFGPKLLADYEDLWKHKIKGWNLTEYYKTVEEIIADASEPGMLKPAKR